MTWRTPAARRRGVEILDDPAVPDAVRDAAMADVEISNRLFGGARAVRHALAPLLAGARALTVLDIGAGRGDITRQIVLQGSRRGVGISAVAVDLSPALARAARDRVGLGAVADATRLPFASRSADIVVASQLLHHFFDGDLRTLVSELHRVSRGWVVVADLERRRLGAAAFWAASIALGFHRITRRDGVTSVMRGFTTAELASLVRDVTGMTPAVRRGLFCRVTATWPAR